jgi:hypothetical protein
MQVDAKLTPASPEVVAGAMVWAYRKTIGREPPTNSSWLLPLAQSAIETAHWSQLFNHNVGNITTTGSGSTDWFSNPHVTVPLKFKAYPKLGAGCMDLYHWLKVHDVVRYADAGDNEGYKNALIAGGYAGDSYPSLDGYTAKYAGISPSLYWEIPTWGAIAIGVGVVGASAYVAHKYILNQPRGRRRVAHRGYRQLFA